MAHLLKNLKDKDVKKRRDTIESIISQTHFDWVSDKDERDIDYAMPSMAEALSDEDAKVRELAIQAIGIELHGYDKDCVFAVMDKIIEVLFDESRKNIHDNAGHILVKAISEGYKLTHDVNELAKLLNREGDDPVKLAITDTLTFHYATNKKWDKVRELIEHKDKEIRQEAIGTLGRYELSKTVKLDPIIPDIIKHIGDENEEVAFVSARSIIGRCHNKDELIPAIKLALDFAKSHTDQKIKNNAIMTINEVISHNVQCNPPLHKNDWDILVPIIEFMEEIIKSGNKDVKDIGVRNLAKYYYHTSNYDKVKALLTNKSPKIRSSVIYELYGCWYNCKVDYDSIIPTVVNLLLKDKNEEVRKAADIRLKDLAGKKLSYSKIIQEEINKAEIDINKNWNFLKKLNESLNAKELRKVKDEIDELKGKPKLSKVKEHLSHENPAIRAWAANEIHTLHSYEKFSVGRVIPDLIKLLEDENDFVREKACATLSYIHEKTKTDEALPYFANLIHDKVDEIALHAAVGLSNFANKGKDITFAIPDLIKEIKIRNKNAVYFVNSTLEKFIKTQKDVTLLREEAKKLKKYKKEVEILIQKRKEDLLSSGKSYTKWPHTQQAAINSYSTYLNLVPDNTDTWINLANLYLKNDRKEDALIVCEKVLKINPEFNAAKTLKKKIESNSK